MNQRYDHLMGINIEPVKKSIQNFLENHPDEEEFKEMIRDNNLNYSLYTAYIAWKKLTSPEIDVFSFSDVLNNLAYGSCLPMEFEEFHNGLFEYHRYGSGQSFQTRDEYEIVVKNFYELLDSHEADEFAAYVVFTPEQSFCEDTPQGIRELVDALIGDERGKKIAVLNLNDSAFIEKSAMHFPSNSYCGIGSDYIRILIQRMRADILRLTNVEYIWENEESLLFDFAFVDNPISPSDDSRLRKDISRNDEYPEFPYGYSHLWNHVGEALFYTQNGGTIIALMNTGSLTGRHAKACRKYVIDRRCVEAVIILPEKMYLTEWVNPVLMILKENNEYVKFFDARGFRTSGRVDGKRINLIEEVDIKGIIAGINADSVLRISNQQIADDDYNLSPLRYLNQSLNTDTVTLETVLKAIRRGVILTGEDLEKYESEESAGQYKCVSPACLENGVIKKHLYINPAGIKRSVPAASYGDLIIDKSGKPFRVAVNEEDELYVIGNLYILEIDRSRFDPWYVKCFLDSEKGQEELSRFSSGSKTPILGIANLKQVRIPIFDDDKQEILNKEAQDATRIIADSYKSIDEQRRRVESMFEEVRETRNDVLTFADYGLDSGTGICTYLKIHGFAIRDSNALDTAQNYVILNDFSSFNWKSRRKQIRLNCKKESADIIEARTGLCRIENGKGDPTRPFSFLFYTYNEFEKAVNVLKSIPGNLKNFNC